MKDTRSGFLRESAIVSSLSKTSFLSLLLPPCELAVSEIGKHRGVLPSRQEGRQLDSRDLGKSCQFT